MRAHKLGRVCRLLAVLTRARREVLNMPASLQPREFLRLRLCDALKTRKLVVRSFQMSASVACPKCDTRICPSGHARPNRSSS